MYGDAAYRGQASIEPGREISELSATANLDKKDYGVTRSQANLCGLCTMRFLHFAGSVTELVGTTSIVQFSTLMRSPEGISVWAEDDG